MKFHTCARLPRYQKKPKKNTRAATTLRVKIQVKILSRQRMCMRRCCRARVHLLGHLLAFHHLELLSRKKKKNVIPMRNLEGKSAFELNLLTKHFLDTWKHLAGVPVEERRSRRAPSLDCSGFRVPARCDTRMRGSDESGVCGGGALAAVAVARAEVQSSKNSKHTKGAPSARARRAGAKRRGAHGEGGAVFWRGSWLRDGAGLSVAGLTSVALVEEISAGRVGSTCVVKCGG